MQVGGLEREFIGHSGERFNPSLWRHELRRPPVGAATTKDLDTSCAHQDTMSRRRKLVLENQQVDEVLDPGADPALPLNAGVGVGLLRNVDVAPRAGCG